MTQEIAPIGTNVPAIHEFAFSSENLRRQVAIVQDCMRAVMRQDHHYGKIPGCGDKPTLLKPGAEVLSMAFRFSPEFKIEQADLGGGHREYSITCSLVHSPTGAFMGQGLGSCSTMEGKYRFRKAERECPACGAATIIKSKAEYGGGWLCYAKKGGCGAKFPEGAEEIVGQIVGQVEHDNPADYYNTCLKMAKKRAYVDAILTCTAASDVFTQDIEENPELFGGRPANGTPKQTNPQASNLDLEQVRDKINSCMTIEQLRSAFKDLNITQKHPQYQDIIVMFQEVQKMIQSQTHDNF
jgi:hypothetical protein